jgi:hypothetical protein
MPYASQAQSRLIHAKAAEGVGWAQKFVADAAGSKVPRRQHVRRRRRGRGRL